MTEKSVLVVDDALVDRMKLTLAVKALGHDVTQAADGVEALDAVDGAKFDVIFLDLLMPRLSGLETLERLKASPETAGIPTVVVTSLGESEEVEAARKLGATSCLSKPFSADDLKEILASIG